MYFVATAFLQGFIGVILLPWLYNESHTVILFQGATVVRMLNNVLGNDAFHLIIQNYFQIFRYDSVAHINMFKTFTKVGHGYSNIWICSIASFLFYRF